jgi:hypothetical protein
MRWSWVVVGGIATLLFVAGVDALRSSDSETSAPTTTASITTAATTVEEALDTPLPPCTPRQLAVSIEVPKGVAVIVVRHLLGASCHPPTDLGLHLAIRDRGGNQVRFLPGRSRDFPSAGCWFLNGTSEQFAGPSPFPLPGVVPGQARSSPLRLSAPTPRGAATSHAARSRATAVANPGEREAAEGGIHHSGSDDLQGGHGHAP